MGLNNRQHMLANVRRFWIDGVLDNSLHGAVLMQLGLRSQPEQVRRPWDVKIRHDGADRALADETRIMDVFDYSGGTLLILGEPGSGKTTLLLELTRDLLNRAETQAEYRLPVVFNLSSWAQDKLPLEKWLVNELNIKYQVARAVAEDWVAQEDLLLLLDGLDEVTEAVRDECVTAINAYHRGHADVPMVVCSRTHDYDILTKKLDFHTAVMIDPLDSAQVDSYLSSFGAGMNGLRQQMASDKRLRALAETPLTLSIMALAYQGVDPATLPEDASMDVQRKHLFDTYIEKMFERHTKSKEHPPEETVRYLSWLAGRMVERRQTLFHIENLQWDWLETRLQQSLYKLFGRLAYGAGIGTIAGGLSVVVMMVLMAVIFGYDVEIYISNTGTQYGLTALLLYGVIGALSGLLIGGIPFGLTGLMAFTADRMSIKGTANSYKKRTALLSILIGTLSGAIGGIILGIINSVMQGGAPQNYGRHLYEFGASSRYMSGVEVYWYWMQFGMLMGIIGGLCASLLAGWWAQKEGRTRQVINGVYGLLIGLIFALTLWITMTPDLRLVDFVLPLLIVCLFTGGIGIVTAGVQDHIESAESIGWRWSWRWAKVGTAVALVVVGLDYLSVQTWTWTTINPLDRALEIFIPVGTVCILVGGVAAGLRKNEKVESRTQPNHGIRRSLKSALKITGAFSIVGVIIALIAMVSILGTQFLRDGTSLAELNEWQLQNLLDNLRGAIVLGLSSGLVASLSLGGTDTVIKHLVLRFMLWRNKDIPLNYARELDHAANMILLRKVGGGYIFVHRYLLEHFAQIESA